MPRINYKHSEETIKKMSINHRGGNEAYALENVMVENSTYGRCSLKRQLIEKNVITYKCQCCGNDGNWNGKKLSLELDHINGVNNDHRLENLRFMCPNCHSQEPTNSGKHKGWRNRRV